MDPKNHWYETHTMGSSDYPKNGQGIGRMPLEKTSLENRLSGLNLLFRHEDQSVDIERTNVYRAEYIKKAHLAPIIKINGVERYRSISYKEGLLNVQYTVSIPLVMPELSKTEQVSVEVAAHLLRTQQSHISHLLRSGVLKGTKGRVHPDQINLQSLNVYKCKVQSQCIESEEST